jgi:hypothetical protein
MPRAFLVTLSLLLIGGSTLGAERPLRIFFVGNSYTFVNDLPGVLTGLAEASRGRRIVTGQHTPGGYTLEQHVKDGKAADDIRKQKWDVVVLQEQSVLPIVQPASMYAGAWKLHETIKSQEARTVFYLTWARKGQPQMQERLNHAYVSIAKALEADVAPVGTAWQRALREDPALELYMRDGSHPSPDGTYLAACVFYATLLDKNPAGLPAEVKKGGKTLLKIDPMLARRLQDVAWRTVQDSK